MNPDPPKPRYRPAYRSALSRPSSLHLLDRASNPLDHCLSDQTDSLRTVASHATHDGACRRQCWSESDRRLACLPPRSLVEPSSDRSSSKQRTLRESWGFQHGDGFSRLLLRCTEWPLKLSIAHMISLTHVQGPSFDPHLQAIDSLQCPGKA